MVEASAGLRNRGGRLREDLQQKYAGVDCRSNDEITTFMIKNTPRRYTDDALMLELSNFLGSDSYDFLYMPWDTKRAHNVGYAFVNFVDADTARKCSALLDGQNWRLVQSPKAIKLIPAHVQGLVLNLVHYVGSSVAEGHTHAPMVIQNGQRIEFHQAVEMFCPKDMVMRQLAEVEAAKLADPEDSKLRPERRWPSDAERRQPSDPHGVTPTQAQSRTQCADRPSRAQEERLVGDSDISRKLHERFMEQAKSQTGKVPAMSPLTMDCLFSDHWRFQKPQVTQVTQTGAVQSVDSYFHRQGPQADTAKIKKGPSFSQSETGVRSAACEEVLGSDSYMLAWQRMNAQLEALVNSGAFGKFQA